MTRIAWSTAAEGAEVIPILLIHGVPAIFYPEGVSVTGLSISSPPDEWWPGNTYGNWTAYGKPWLSLRGDGVSISERAQPTQSQQLDVSEVTVYLADIDDGTNEYAATALFSNANNLVSTYITATVSASATSFDVVSTAAFASSGVVYLGQEAIAYGGKTATAFTSCTRGAFGSTPTRHLYDEAAGTGLGNPVALSGPDEIIGRPATLWLAEVTAGVITRLSLEHFGNVGTGAALADDSGQLRIRMLRRAGNAGMIGTGYPGGVVAAHAVVAGQAIHDRLIERMAHVQRAGHVGRGQLDGKGGRTILGGLGATETGHAVAALFPLGAPMGFQGGGFERFGQAFEAGLFDGEGGRVAHVGALDKKKTACKNSMCQCCRWA